MARAVRAPMSFHVSRFTFHSWPMNIVVVGLSHHSAPVEVRERFAVAEGGIPGALEALRKSGVVEGAVILSTCNRVEIYAATALEPAPAFSELKQFLSRWGETPSGPN